MTLGVFADNTNWVDTFKAVAEDSVQVNHFREKNIMYDVLEAHRIMKEHLIINEEYEMTETFTTDSDILQPNGLSDFASIISSLSDPELPLYTIYTCRLYILLILIIHGKLVLIDTHPISKDIGGSGQGVLKVYPDCSYTSALALGKGMALRLRKGKSPAEAKQSLLVIKEAGKSK